MIRLARYHHRIGSANAAAQLSLSICVRLKTRDTIMSKIDEIKEKLSKLYKWGAQSQNVNIPRPLQAQEWFSFCREYIDAATELDKHGFKYILPRIQLTGHAVEGALKSCLLAANRDPTHQHDLVFLYKECEKLCIMLDEKSLGAIVHLNHYYFCDLATETKFKARYPAKNVERLGGAILFNVTYVSIVNTLLKYAEGMLSEKNKKISS